MKINELFEKILVKFSPEDLNGEYTLQGNCIVWTFTLENYTNEEPPTYYNEDDEEELLDFCFESVSCEELLNDAYNSDFEKIESLLDELDETENWTFADPEIIDDTISFKLF